MGGQWNQDPSWGDEKRTKKKMNKKKGKRRRHDDRQHMRDIVNDLNFKNRDNGKPQGRYNGESDFYDKYYDENNS